MSEPAPVLGRLLLVLVTVGVLGSACSVKSIDSDLSESLRACKGDVACRRQATNEWRCFEWAEQTGRSPADCLRAVRVESR